MNTLESRSYSLSDKYLQIAHKIADFLNRQQQSIEPNKEGISSELEKIITYLNARVKQKARVNLFTYLEQLIEHGEIIGHSQKTTQYYEIIDEICNLYLKKYESKPTLIIQILSWSKRLMGYYKKVNPDSEIDNSLIKQTEKIAVETHKIAKPIKTEVAKILERPEEAQPPKLIESPKPVERSKPEVSKLSEPPKPWERPSKKPSR
jgi:hypothetical protein